MVKDQETDSHKILLLDTGDLVQGTGLSDGTDVSGEFIFKEVKNMPYDALSIGNHELASEDIPDYMLESNFTSYWNGSYLGANVQYDGSSQSTNTFTSPYILITEESL